MGERPSEKTIHRINNNGNYEIGNCKWADLIEQGSNKGKYRRRKQLTESEIKEVFMLRNQGKTLREIAIKLNTTSTTIGIRLKNPGRHNMVYNKNPDIKMKHVYVGSIVNKF